jgi:hypothetical protein
MKNASIRSSLAALLILGLALTACSQPAPTASGAATSVAATQAPADTGGEAGGVEGASLVTYSDAAQGFAIGHPSTWTQDPAFKPGVKFAGGDDSLALEFVTAPSGVDAMMYAKNDVAAVGASFPGFKQLSLAASTEVATAVVLSFEANGTSAVTGKAFAAHDERYYMPLADGRLAILTLTGPAAHYDREGFRDIALTFRLTK